MNINLCNILVEPLPGCPSFKEFVGLPIEINGSCIATCAVNTKVSYLCDECSTVPIGYATCTEDYMWIHSHSLDMCTPDGEQNTCDKNLCGVNFGNIHM